MQYYIMIWNATPVTGSCRLNYRNCRRRDFEGGVDAMRVMVIIVEVPTIESGTAMTYRRTQHANVVSLTRPILSKSTEFLRIAVSWTCIFDVFNFLINGTITVFRYISHFWFPVRLCVNNARHKADLEIAMESIKGDKLSCRCGVGIIWLYRNQSMIVAPILTTSLHYWRCIDSTEKFILTVQRFVIFCDKCQIFNVFGDFLGNITFQ